MMRHMVGVLAHPVPLLAVLWLTNSVAAEPQRGIIQTVQGRCLIVRAGIDAPVLAAPHGFVVAGDSISCQTDSQLAFSLPGSGRLQDVPAGTSHLVPATPRLPEPPVGIGKRGGRTAQVITKCATPLGTLAVSEDRTANGTDSVRALFQLPPPEDLVRAVVQQSNCFVLVDRNGARDRAMDRTRLSDRSTVVQAFSAASRNSRDIGGGQNRMEIVAPDFSIVVALAPPRQSGATPGEEPGEEPGAAIGAAKGLLAGKSVSRGATQQPRAQLMLLDNRQGAMLNNSEGQPSNSDLSEVEEAILSIPNVTAGRYLGTSQGRMIAASYVDAYNKMVMELLASRGSGSNIEAPDPSTPERRLLPAPAAAGTRN